MDLKTNQCINRRFEGEEQVDLMPEILFKNCVVPYDLQMIEELKEMVTQNSVIIRALQMLLREQKDIPGIDGEDDDTSAPEIDMEGMNMDTFWDK